MTWSPKRCIKFLNKMAEMKDIMNELTDDDVEILKLVSESLVLDKRFKELNKKEGESK